MAFSRYCPRRSFSYVFFTVSLPFSRENKTPCRYKGLHGVREDTGWTGPTAGFFLRISLKKGILVLRCGRCPLCRWAFHLRRCKGTAIPLHCRILFSVFAGTRSGFGKFCFVFNTTSPFCPRPLRPYFAQDMIGKRTRTSPFLLDFQGVSGFVLIITYGHSYAVAALQSGDDIKTVQENLGITPPPLRWMCTAM